MFGRREVAISPPSDFFYCKLRMLLIGVAALAVVLELENNVGLKT